MTGRQLGRKSSSNIQVDRRPQTALKVLYTQEEEWKQQTKCWPRFLRAGRCSSREFKGETEIIVDKGGKKWAVNYCSSSSGSESNNPTKSVFIHEWPCSPQPLADERWPLLYLKSFRSAARTRPICQSPSQDQREQMEATEESTC